MSPLISCLLLTPLNEAVALERARLFERAQQELAERKRVEDTLEKERSFVSAILDTVGALVVVLDLEGRVVVINFWASWCVECRVEADELEALWQEYQDEGVVFVGVDYDDTEVKAKQYLEEFGITYPNALDPGNKVARAYRVRGVPETFFIKDGGIADLYIGPLTEDQLVTRIERLLAR